jgi:glucosamine--fructose-6-phosphate aminotransferase (isomerizing)
MTFGENLQSTILESEIQQQPDIIRHLIESERENVERIVQKVQHKFKYILIAARGTSDNAARYAQYLFGINNQIQVALATPSIFSIYEKAVNLDEALVIGISQSGQSPDIISVLTEGKKQGRPTLALTNDPESPLGKVAEHVIPLWANPEKAVAATKTYTSSL